MDAMLVVDMQNGLLKGLPKHDLDGVVDRINSLGTKVRCNSGVVIFVQHCGPAGDDFEPETHGWEILPKLQRKPTDIVIRKALNDPFRGTSLHQTLTGIGADRVLIAGWATDLCVDATVRSAVAHAYDVVVVSDCHTVSDRPHLDAVAVIRHHHWVWSNLITPRSLKIARSEELQKQLR